MKTLNEYQDLATSMAVYAQPTTRPVPDPWTFGVAYLALKLNGEAGEVAEKIGKALRGDYPVMSVRGDLLLELGDVLWYLSQLARELGYSMEDVATGNISKLADRKSRNTLRGNGDAR